jgi:hypothetical protein
MTIPRLLPGEIPTSGPGIDDYSDEMLSEADAAALLAEDEAYAAQAHQDALLQDFESKAFHPDEPRDPATGEWTRTPGSPGSFDADNRDVSKAVFGVGTSIAKNRKAAKAKVVHDIADAIKMSPALKDWAKKEGDGGDETELVRFKVQGILDAWASNAVGNPYSQALQQIAAERFGGAYTPVAPGTAQDVARNIRRTLDGTLERDRPVLEAVFDAVYDNTQKMLKRKGLDHVTLYRGETVRNKHFSPLSSWTSSQKMAATFADGSAWLSKPWMTPPVSHLYALTVPASRVWSTAVTGPGALHEHEFILLAASPGEVALQAESKAFHPDELRDLAGRWTRSGSSGDLLKHMVREGGFTFDVNTGLHESHGFVVAVSGHSRIFRQGEFTDSAVDAYLLEKMPVLAANSHLRLGGWYDREHDEVVLDLVELHEDRDTAIRLGQERDEQAIFDLDTGSEIATGGSGGRKHHEHAGGEPPGGAGPPAGELRRPAGGGTAGLGAQVPGGSAGVKDLDRTGSHFNPAELRDLLGRWARAGGRTDGDVPRFSLVTPEPVTGIRRSSRHVTVARQTSELLGSKPFHHVIYPGDDPQWQHAQQQVLKHEAEARAYQRGIDRNEVIPSHLDRPREGVPLGSVDDTGGLHLTAEQYAAERDKRLEAAKVAALARDMRAAQFDNPRLDGSNSDGLGPDAQKHLDAILHAGRLVEKEAHRRAAVRMKEAGVDVDSIVSAERDLSEEYQKVNVRRMDAIDAEVDRILAEHGWSHDDTQAVYTVREDVLRTIDKTHPDVMADYALAEQAGILATKHSRRAEKARAQLLAQARREVLTEIRPMGPGGLDDWQTYITESTSEPGYQSRTMVRVKVGDVLKGTGPGKDMEVTGVTGVTPTTITMLLKDSTGAEHGVTIGRSWIAAVKRPEGQPDEPTEEDQAALAGLLQAEQFYPTNWLDRSAAAGPIKMIVTDRGFYDATDARLALSGVSQPDEAIRTATHELGHRMERVVPDLMAAEWAYYLSRTSTPRPYGVERTGKNALQRVPGYGQHEQTRPDDFPNPYTGKEYGGGPDDPYELLTTSMESLFGHSPYADQGLTEFTLGALATL